MPQLDFVATFGDSRYVVTADSYVAAEALCIEEYGRKPSKMRPLNTGASRAIARSEGRI